MRKKKENYQTDTVTKMYVVYFDGLGYYADKQPHYKWSFTEDLFEAKQYKTKTGAENLIHRSRGLAWSGYPLGKLQEVMIKTTTEINVIAKQDKKLKAPCPISKGFASELEIFAGKN